MLFSFHTDWACIISLNNYLTWQAPCKTSSTQSPKIKHAFSYSFPMANKEYFFKSMFKLRF
ncbi:MAG: hypothetical protein ACI81W_002958 [Saprospiraceae bacterium]|jgi:hypothetical protein